MEDKDEAPPSRPLTTADPQVAAAAGAVAATAAASPESAAAFSLPVAAAGDAAPTAPAARAPAAPAAGLAAEDAAARTPPATAAAAGALPEAKTPKLVGIRLFLGAAAAAAAAVWLLLLLLAWGELADQPLQGPWTRDWTRGTAAAVFAAAAAAAKVFMPSRVVAGAVTQEQVLQQQAFQQDLLLPQQSRQQQLYATDLETEGLSVQNKVAEEEQQQVLLLLLQLQQQQRRRRAADPRSVPSMRLLQSLVKAHAAARAASAARAAAVARAAATTAPPAESADAADDDLRELLLREGWLVTDNKRQKTIRLPQEARELLLQQGGLGLQQLLLQHIQAASDTVTTIPSPTVSTLTSIASGSSSSSRSSGGVNSSSGLVLLAGSTPRRLLTSSAYSRAYKQLSEALHPDRLTRAVKVGGQYLYPWSVFTDQEREQLRLMADQLKWLPKWIKHHRVARRPPPGALRRHLPVLQPVYTDRYGGPGSAAVGASPGVRYTWLGHASGVLSIDGLNVLIDPVLGDDIVGAMHEWAKKFINFFNTKLCGSLGERLRRAPARVGELPPDLHLVVLSHNHQDHIMEGDIQKLCRTHKARFKHLMWYVPEGVAWFLVKHGCSPKRVYEFTWGESRTLSCMPRNGQYSCTDGVWRKSSNTSAHSGITRSRNNTQTQQQQQQVQQSNRARGKGANRGPVEAGKSSNRHSHYFRPQTSSEKQDNRSGSHGGPGDIGGALWKRSPLFRGSRWGRAALPQRLPGTQVSTASPSPAPLQQQRTASSSSQHQQQQLLLPVSGEGGVEGDTPVDHFTITFVGNVHWSGRSPAKTDHNTSLWGGFAVKGPRHSFFFGGDTSYLRPEFDEFRKVGRLLGPFHLAAIAIGAYEPNEDLRFQHVNPQEALALYKDIRAEVAVGVHWGTMRLSAENLFDPMLELECALLGVPLHACRGETMPPATASAASANPAPAAGCSGAGNAGTAVAETATPSAAGAVSPAALASAGATNAEGGEAQAGGATKAPQKNSKGSGPSKGSIRAAEAEGVGDRVNSNNGSSSSDAMSTEATVEDPFRHHQREVESETLVAGSTVTACVLLEPEPELDDPSVSAAAAPVALGVSSGTPVSGGSSNVGEIGGGGSLGTLTSGRGSGGVSKLRPAIEAFLDTPVAALRRGRRPGNLREAFAPGFNFSAALQPVKLWSDPLLYPSNFRRLRRAEKLESLGLLDNDPHWRERLLVDGSRFQTLHIGHSIQVEEGGDGTYLLMSRSSARDHIDPTAAAEQYAFLPRYFTPSMKQKGASPEASPVFSDIPFSYADAAAEANLATSFSNAVFNLEHTIGRPQYQILSPATAAAAADFSAGRAAWAAASATTPPAAMQQHAEQQLEEDLELFDVLD
ncbi:hypothetical protein, conserved [Eimeria necatrix]|uniref:Metallo-beta-lactamase domain-containing protein n=1 Tax=Eimeria necatrix TaxID=51315 RepID=U6MLM6_9EIME|nr:hypothetical protein, conserved [Eimeria necatrix]CDJ65127.1 hypothetical protein, conserved [Eimeria necatrix]